MASSGTGPLWPTSKAVGECHVSIVGLNPLFLAMGGSDHPVEMTRAESVWEPARPLSWVDLPRVRGVGLGQVSLWWGVRRGVCRCRFLRVRGCGRR